MPGTAKQRVGRQATVQRAGGLALFEGSQGAPALT